LQGEAGADRLQAVQGQGLISAVNAAEVIAKLVSKGTPLSSAQTAFEALHIEVSPFDAGLAANSGRYVRKGVSLGDRCFLATALRFGPGWTSDRELGKIKGDGMPVLQFFR
jgi:PIN domain nuclease of toxin-antitoxin system